MGKTADASIVHEDVDASESLLNVLGEHFHGLKQGDVALHDFCPKVTCTN
jgi:hypothetical protein